MTRTTSLLGSLRSAIRPLALAIACALPVVACSGGDEDKAPTPPASGTTVSGEDIVNVDDLLVEDSGAGATKLGDPAVWLGAARQEIKQANAYARAALGPVAALASTEPTRRGTLPSGEPYALWRADREGVTYSLMVARVGENRLRYLLLGAKGTDRKPLLTGLFLKRGEKRGAGRLHLDLGNLNALTGAPAATGRLHLMFANSGEGRARRFRYREVKPAQLGQEDAINYGVDALHRPGKGGLLRAYAIGDLGSRIADLADLDGVQIAAFRARWTPQGGRASAAVFDLEAGASTRLGEAHECWDGGGLRAAYQSFTGNENEGDVTVDASCGGFAREDAPAEVPADGIEDAEVNDQLTEALTVSEADASIELALTD